MPKQHHVDVALNDYRSPAEPMLVKVGDTVVFRRTPGDTALLHVRVSHAELFDGDTVDFQDNTTQSDARTVMVNPPASARYRYVLLVREGKHAPGSPPPDDKGPGGMTGRGTIVVVGGDGGTKDPAEDSA